MKRLFLTYLYKIFLIFEARKRFTYCLLLVKFIHPVISKFSYYSMPTFALGNQRDYLTASVLNSLTLNDIEFDVELEVNGAELIGGSGAILICGHFYLNFVFLRWLYDKNHSFSVFLLTGDECRIVGTKDNLDILSNQPMKMKKALRLISNGQLVVSAIDYNVSSGSWDKKLDTPGVDIFVSDQLIKMGERTNTPVFFFDTYIDKNNQIVSDIVAATSNESAIVLEEFSQFISSALDKRK